MRRWSRVVSSSRISSRSAQGARDVLVEAQTHRLRAFVRRCGRTHARRVAVGLERLEPSELAHGELNPSSRSSESWSRVPVFYEWGLRSDPRRVTERSQTPGSPAPHSQRAPPRREHGALDAPNDVPGRLVPRPAWRAAARARDRTRRLRKSPRLRPVAEGSSAVTKPCERCVSITG